MSNDEPFYSPNRKPPAARTQRTVGELLWEVYVDHVFWGAELFDEQAYGFDVRLFRGCDFFGSRRWANRDAAIAWANEQRGNIGKGWDDGRPTSCLFALWPATSSSKRLHDIDKLVQKCLHTRELFPRLDVVKHRGRLVGSAAAAFPFAPLRLWARPFHG